MIHECPVTLERVVVHRLAFGGNHQWFAGQVQAVHIDTEYRRDQSLMFWGGEYRRVGELLEPAWKRTQETN